VTLEEYLADKNPDAVALFGRFQELVEACGPSEIRPKRTIVYWARKRVFAGAFVEARRLELNVDLLREAEHPSLLAAFHTTNRVITHRLRVTDASQLDDGLAALVREAYEQVGLGAPALH
jgi:hypothetical protein